MSKGPGRVERIVEAAFAADPDNAFTVEDLCDKVYPGEVIAKKHRVAVLRAAKQITKRRGEIHSMVGESLGRAVGFYDQYRVLSYAMARLKTDNLNRYRSNDKRNTWILPRYMAKGSQYGDPGKGMVWRIKSQSSDEEQLRARLNEDGADHKLVVPGGVWWQHVQMNIAERDGDIETFERLKAEGEAAFAALFAVS
jgi:hypothetical protein